MCGIETLGTNEPPMLKEHLNSCSAQMVANKKNIQKEWWEETERVREEVKIGDRIKPMVMLNGGCKLGTEILGLAGCQP